MQYDVIVTSMIFSTNDGYLHEFINIFTFHWKIDELIGGFRIVLSVICKLKVYVLKRDKWFGGFTKQPWFNLVVSRCNLQLSLSSINCMQQKHPINELFSLNLNIYFYVQEKQLFEYSIGLDKYSNINEVFILEFLKYISNPCKIF